VRAWIPGGRMTKISIIRNSNSGDHSLLSHTPRPDGTMEGLRLPDVLCDNWCGGPAQGALGDRVGATLGSLENLS
jgi:hypothetical protein